MLKFFFWSLLAINAVLFAFGRGYLGNVKPGEREPARIARQLNTDKIVLLSAAAARNGGAGATTAPAGPDAAAPVLAVACAEVGNFAAIDARRFERLLEPLELGARLTKEEVPIQEITSYRVMIPPLGSKQAADQKAAEIKELGVSSYFIMNDSTPTKWAISLGVFKAETAAQTLLAALVKQGVTGAKVAGRSSTSKRQVFRVRDIDSALKARLDEAAKRFDGIETRACSQAPASRA